jgi:tRNA(Arg) A34 adenosine deaminase TadA
MGIMIDKAELKHLERCIELAVQAMESGEEPFGSVLVGGDGAVLAEDHNRITSTGDPTAHPEFALARWAAANMAEEERAAATVYTSGEHCPMCSAAHGWVGLGRIVYAASSAQLTEWRTGWGEPASPVAAIPAQDVAPGVTVEGPVPELAERMHEVHHRFHARAGRPPSGQ